MSLDPSPLISGWGIPGFFIAVLAAVIIYLSRKIDSKDKKIEEILLARIQDNKESRDAVVAPLELIGRQNDLILKNINGNK